MIRVYFVFEDPLDESGVNLSFVDVPTREAEVAFGRVEEAAESGELWRLVFPEDEGAPYKLINTKMSFLDVSGLRGEVGKDTLLPI